MTHRVVVTARARAEALEAFVWLAERSPEAAERWYLALQRAIRSLSTMPERNPVAEEESELLGVTLRQMLHGRRGGTYRLLFSIQDEVVTLHHIRHASQGPIEP
jgi:plasmid stabilization system protein ParE